MTITLNWKQIQFKNILIGILIIILIIIIGSTASKPVPVQEQISVCSELQYKEWWDDCVNHKDDWYPWQIATDEDWNDYQVIPQIEPEISDSHERFKQLAYKYHLDPSVIWTVENKYNIREWLILAIIIAETSWGRNGNYVSEWCYNVGNVWNNDRWDRNCYSTREESIAAIWKALNNDLLWNKQTVACLSKAWHCNERFDNWKIYAGSPYNWERTVMKVLSDIYQRDNPDSSMVYIRRDYKPYY